MAAPTTTELPDKLNYGIGEVARHLGVAAHVLRYWEKEFPQVAPIKRAGNRRFYRRADVALLAEIKHLLYDRGFTISGARDHLRRKADPEPLELLRRVRDDLRQLHRQLTTPP